ncbi:MAG: 3-dehydroquinate synthase [Planctomycetota bacterium]|jgi:3-dehydroquinate synthase
MATVRVELGERSYEVLIEKGAVGRVARHLPAEVKPTRVLVISDENVAPLYGAAVTGSLESAGLAVSSAVIAPGEEEKNLRRVEWLYHRMLENGLDRKSLVVALGGGVVGDIAGFAAATFMRGIPHVQVPTTIVSQVDSSVGGKTGVDLGEGKNLVGAFHQPLAVVIDPETLSTLPPREVSAGLAEVIKHGVIRDAGYFGKLEELGPDLMEMDADTAAAVVLRSVEIKAEVVSADERESGLRAILNFGHTVGHALEALTGYSKYLHGEAVSIGMAAAANVAAALGMCDRKDAERIRALCAEAGLPVSTEGVAGADVIAAFARDKKAVGGKPRFILPSRIGKVEIVDGVDESVVRNALVETGFAG